MQATKKRAGLVLGVICLMIPVRWAAAAEASPLGDGLAPLSAVESSPAPAQLSADDQLRAFSDAYLSRTGPAFYEGVGRPDLAKRYRSRADQKALSRTFGAIALGAGMIGWMVAKLHDPCTDLFGLEGETYNCMGETTYWKSDIAMVSGLMLLIGPSFVQNDPMSEEEQIQLADEAARRFQRTLHPRIGVSAAPLPGGGDVLLSMTF